MIGLGFLGLMYFGILFAAIKIIDHPVLNWQGLEALIGPTRMHRRRRWVRHIPVLLGLSTLMLFAGVVLRLAIAA